MSSHVLELSGLGGLEALRAIGSETRLNILMLLAEGEMNIHEMAEALNLTQPSITRHVLVLEAAGLVQSEMRAGVQGLQKRCRLCYEQLIFDFEHKQPPLLRVEDVEMPIGMYSVIQAETTCGLANREKTIWWANDPQAFFHPERATAEILWLSKGFVEYIFPNCLPASVTIHRLTLIMELCSEANDYNNDYPSDITFWINGIEIGTWTSPGDMGGARGRLNPPWWQDNMSQYGFLKMWDVDSTGTYLDGVRVADVTLSEIGVAPHLSITARIGIKPDAVHSGGFNLFGRGYGNYEQDVILRLHYSVLEAAPLPEGGDDRD